MLPETADRLREQAARCRRLVGGTIDFEVRCRLLELAVEFERARRRIRSRDGGTLRRVNEPPPWPRLGNKRADFVQLKALGVPEEPSS